MKRFLFLLLIICLSKVAPAAAYPSVEQVVTKLYANYAVPDMAATEKVHYQKKRDGWHVVHMVYNDTLKNYTGKKQELFWSVASGKYTKLTLFPAGVTAFSHDRVREDLRGIPEYDYARCPYFGYVGWDVDVIADFARYNGTNDTIYEGLARAYANFAKGYTFHQYSYHIEAQQQLTEKERVDAFIENEKKAIAVYDDMRKRRPYYEMITGSPHTKYCNEIMATYEDLLYYRREAEMQPYFKEELYDPFILCIARNMLESCGTNGILFTNGDNDSFPLWYLQWIKGVRTDVAVMNLSLMNTAHYLDRYRDGFLKAPPVKMSIAKPLYDAEDYFSIEKYSIAKQMTAADFFRNVHTEGEAGKEEIFFRPGRIVVRNTKPLPPEYNRLAEDSVVISVEQSYLYQGEMAMIDITLTNFEARPVYVASTSSIVAALHDYFFAEGMISRFIPGAVKPHEGQMGWMTPVASTEIFRKNMMNLLQGDTACRDHFNGGRWTTNIKLTTIYAAEICATDNPKDALALLNALYGFCPLTKTEPVDVYALDVYYKAGDERSGDALGTALLDHLERELNRFATKRYLDMTMEERTDRERNKTALAMAKMIFNTHGRALLSTRAQQLMDQF